MSPKFIEGSLTSNSEPTLYHSGYGQNYTRFNDGIYKLLTNFNKTRTAVYEKAIEEAKKLNLPNVDKLVISSKAYDGKGRLMENYSALKIENRDKRLLDLAEFWRLFEKISKGDY